MNQKTKTVMNNNYSECWSTTTTTATATANTTESFIISSSLVEYGRIPIQDCTFFQNRRLDDVDNMFSIGVASADAVADNKKEIKSSSLSSSSCSSSLSSKRTYVDHKRKLCLSSRRSVRSSLDGPLNKKQKKLRKVVRFFPTTTTLGGENVDHHHHQQCLHEDNVFDDRRRLWLSRSENKENAKAARRSSKGVDLDYLLDPRQTGTSQPTPSSCSCSDAENDTTTTQAGPTSSGSRETEDDQPTATTDDAGAAASQSKMMLSLSRRLADSADFQAQRGLERYSSRRHGTAQSVTMLKARVEVFLEQSSQVLKGHSDPTRIARLYETSSQPAVRFAHILGLADAATARHVQDQQQQQQQQHR